MVGVIREVVPNLEIIFYVIRIQISKFLFLDFLDYLGISLSALDLGI